MNQQYLSFPILLIFLAGQSCLAQAKEYKGQPNRSGESSEARVLLPSSSGLRVPDLVVDHLYDLIHLIQITRLDSPSSSRPSSKFESTQVFEDSNDAAVVARVNKSPSNEEDTCIAVFQATDFENILDVAQLFNWETETITVNGEGGTVSSCTFRAGMVSAYYHSSYYDEFVAAVDRCMATDKLQKTPKLLLGGHSQGGAIAVVASIDLNRYEPAVVTLGAVRSLVEPCTTTPQTTSSMTLGMLMNKTATGQGQGQVRATGKVIDPTNHYRFVNAINSAYDYWTTVFNRNGIHVGQPIFLDPTASPGYMASSTYLNDDFNMEPTDTFNHDPDIYWLCISQWLEYEKARCAADGNNDPCEFVVRGWEDGHYCNLASECSGGFCVKNTCRSRP